MLKLKHYHDWPLVVADHTKDFNNWSITLTKRCTTSLVLLSVTQMNIANSFMVFLNKCQAIAISCGEVACIKCGRYAWGE